MLNVKPAVKKCPSCGKKVPADKNDCACGYDMLAVDIFENKSEALPLVLTRICLCGNENGSEEIKCKDCGRSVQDTELTESGTVFYLLTGADQSCCVKITREPVIIGRQAEICAEYLGNKDSVSREHLKLEMSGNGMLEATDISSYGTWLNGGKMNKNMTVFAGEGDEFSLSGPDGAEYAAYFKLVKVKSFGESIL